MKKVLYGVLAALVGVMLLAAVFFRRQASTAPVRLSDRYLDAVTSLRLHFPDGSSFAPDYINKDFLHVLNLWEIDEIASDSQTHALRAQEPVTLTLKNKSRTVYKKKGYTENGNFYLDAGRKGLYKMRCDYLPNTWAGFFDPASPLWQNRLLLDLHYYEIRSVTLSILADVSAGADDVSDGAVGESCFCDIAHVAERQAWSKKRAPTQPRTDEAYILRREDNADTIRYTLTRPGHPPVDLPTTEAQAHLTAYKQIYYDPVASTPDTLASALYTLVIETTHGAVYTLTIYPYDLFKALVTTPTDTLLVPHLALDKMTAFTK